MALTFKPRSFIAYGRDLKVIALDSGLPVIFRLDLAAVGACLGWARDDNVDDVVERSRDVIELACRVAYSKDQERRATMQLCQSDIATAAERLRSVATISKVDLAATV